MLTLILLGAFHVHLQCVLLKHSFGEVEEAADPADVLALLRVLRLAVLDEGSGAPCWFPTENTDESLSVSPLMSHQSLQKISCYTVNIITVLQYIICLLHGIN